MNVAGQPAHLSVNQLTKKFGVHTIFNPVSFDLEAGQIAVLTGANGSGKTTLLTCIAGLLPADSGSVSVLGYDLYREEVEVRKRMIFVPDVPRFYSELTAWEHLQFIAMANNASAGFEAKAEALMKRFSLWQARDLFPHHYSRGMRLKLGLLMALMRPFDVLLLDEPASALDEQGQGELIDLLRSLKANGAALLLSSHHLPLAEAVADRRLRLDDANLIED